MTDKNLIFFDVEQSGGVMKTFAIIDRGNGEFTSMLKSTYEAMQAEQSEAVNYLTLPAIMESTQPDEADLTEGTN
jgi:hypothetical protein